MTIFPTKILLAVDDSEKSELATRRAIDLADTAGSELYVVYVRQLPNFLMNDPDIMGFYRKLYDEIEQESLEILWRLTWQVKLSGGDVAGANLKIGNVAEEIVQLAKDLEADLIVMGSRGVSLDDGHDRLVGSVTERVLHRAPCPVLVIRAEATTKL